MNDVRPTMNRLTPAYPGITYDRPALDPKLGGQFEWFWAVPAVFRALVTPDAGHPLPAPPTDESDHAQQLGYWGALQYMLLRRLGWRYPASGLTWWYDNGKPVDDPTLALVKRAWDHDGHLDEYLAWMLDRPRRFDLNGQPAEPWATDAPAAPTKWRRWSRDCLQTARWFEGDSDSMHLTAHFGEQGTPDEGATLTVIDQPRHRAAFITSTMDAWYGDLVRLGASLPVLQSKAWRVDVYVQPVGFLGSFCRSWETELWFTGRHHIHAAGNRPQIT